MNSYIQLNGWAGNDQDSACASMAKVFRLDHAQANKIIKNLVKGKSWKNSKVISKNQLEVAEGYLKGLGFSLELISEDAAQREVYSKGKIKTASTFDFKKFYDDFELKQFYFSWEGRIGRKQLWLYAIIPIFVLNIISQIIFFLWTGTPLLDLSALQADQTPDLSGFVPTMTGFGVIMFIVSMVFFYVEIVITIKRLHDLDYSGWWLLSFMIPIMLMVFGLWIESVVFTIFSILIYIGFAVWLFWLFIVKVPFFSGTDGSNQFGHAYEE